MSTGHGPPHTLDHVADVSDTANESEKEGDTGTCHKFAILEEQNSRS